MLITRNVSFIIMQSVQHVVVGSVLISCIIVPIASAQLVIGIKPIGFVAHRHTKPNGMTWNDIRQFIFGCFSPTTRFKPIAIRQ